MTGPLRVFILGAATAVDRALDAVSGDLRGPVREYQHTTPCLSFGFAGTVVVPEIASLTPTEQDALSVWLTQSPLASVVALSSEAVWPRVARGEFSAKLFYRLNVITIDLTGHS